MYHNNISEVTMCHNQPILATLLHSTSSEVHTVFQRPFPAFLNMLRAWATPHWPRRLDSIST